MSAFSSPGSTTTKTSWNLHDPLELARVEDRGLRHLVGEPRIAHQGLQLAGIEVTGVLTENDSIRAFSLARIGDLDAGRAVGDALQLARVHALRDCAT